MNKETFKRALKWTFWTMLIAWNLFWVYVMLDKRDITKQQAQPTPAAQMMASQSQDTMPIKAKPHTSFETELASYNLTNDTLTKIVLKKYMQNSKEHIVLNNTGRINWAGNTETPNENTVWNITQDEQGITMQWQNREDITFVQRWIFGDNYDVVVQAEVINNSKRTVKITPTFCMQKDEFEKHQSFIFSGITIGIGKEMHNIAPAKVVRKNLNTIESAKGFTAFNEKYWLTTATSTTMDTINTDHKDGKNFQLSLANKEMQIAEGNANSSSFTLYAGPKDVHALQKFSRKSQISNIENTIDYGWLFFLTKPVSYMLKYFIELLGSVGLALVVLVILLKLVSWPFTTSSHIAMKKMQDLNPTINEIKTRLKGTPELMNKEIFALYKKHKINPISGCLPSVLQMLMIFPLYKVLSFSIDLHMAPFPWWISDLSSPDPTSIINLFGFLPFAAPSFLHIGAWPILMGLTMFWQQLISAVPMPGTDNEAQKITKYGMPILFTWMMAGLPAGVAIYLTLTYLLTIFQIMWVNYSNKKKQKHIKA